MTFTKKTLLSLAAATIGVLSINAAIADSVVRVEKLHPSANRSYKVAGKRYTPLTKVSSFSQTGKASWYGNQFHGRKTSSGERYNMNALSAAHKTLPIPSYARVTNMQNGKSVIVRVNDRGPFHGNRVIDVSKAAAQQLGFINQGSANVKVEQIIPGQTAAQTIISPNNKEFFVDLKSFGTQREAQAYLNQAAQNLPSDSKIMLEKRNYEYVVKMGPFSSQERAAEAGERARHLNLASAI